MGICQSSIMFWQQNYYVWTVLIPSIQSQSICLVIIFSNFTDSWSIIPLRTNKNHPIVDEKFVNNTGNKRNSMEFNYFSTYGYTQVQRIFITQNWRPNIILKHWYDTRNSYKFKWNDRPIRKLNRRQRVCVCVCSMLKSNLGRGMVVMDVLCKNMQ